MYFLKTPSRNVLILISTFLVFGCGGGSSGDPQSDVLEDSPIEDSQDTDAPVDPPVEDTQDTDAPVDPPVEDTQDTDGDTAAAAAFLSQLESIRSYGCEPGAEGQFTTEFVEVYANGVVTSDFWLYEEPECRTRPLTLTTTLPIQTYVLENPVLTPDGREAFEVVLETQQVSSEDTAGFPVGTTLFDILALEQGGVTQGTTFATTPEERPTDLLGAAPATPIGQRAEPASRENLMGSWLAGCFNGRISERNFGEQQFIETNQVFVESDCITPLATIITTWDITYFDPLTTVFGQSALRTSIESVDSRFNDLVIDANFPAPPSLTEIGLRFEDIWAVIDNELVIGTCFDKGPGDCGIGENIPDLLNFNVGNRFVRQ